MIDEWAEEYSKMQDLLRWRKWPDDKPGSKGQTTNIYVVRLTNNSIRLMAYINNKWCSLKTSNPVNTYEYKINYWIKLPEFKAF